MGTCWRPSSTKNYEMTESGPEQKQEGLRVPPHWVRVCWCYARDCEYCFAAYYCDHGETECCWCREDETVPTQIDDRAREVSAESSVSSDESDRTRLPEKETNQALQEDLKSVNEEEPSSNN